MCGFVGYVGAPAPTPLLEFSRDLLRHRGPDSDGLWESINADRSVGLGFRRLKILDLSPAANQPMSRGNVRLVYNGEVYNFRELRGELEAKGHVFETSGDTEVVLAAYRQWGVDAIPRLEGMFALAIWDEEEQRLVLARDRAGIKPLYYGEYSGRFAFASEPKSVLKLLARPADLAERSLAKFLTFLWVPDPDTLFEGIFKLPPAHYAVLDRAGLRIREYWDLVFDEEPGTMHEHAERLREAIRTAVRRQLVSDVPLGVFLSGGLDSTLIARLAAEETSHPLLAIAAGAPEEQQRLEPGVPDLPYARVAAKEIPNLDYREILLDAMSSDTAVDLVEHMDDPVADPAAIATYLICRAAKPQATVMLSGVGAEELFAGYPRHRAVRALSRIEHLPAATRRAMARAAAPLPGTGRLRRIKKFLQGVGDDEPYLAFVAHHDKGSLSALLGRDVDWDEVTETHRRHLEICRGLPPVARALYLDFKTFLPSLNLAYTDRASMATSIEVRVPLLDEDVVARAVRVPDAFKVAGRAGKAILRHASAGLVPEAILSRPKSGFGGPVRSWMRDPSGQVADLLSPASVSRRGLTGPSEVKRMQNRLTRGQSDESLPLWAIANFELWARRHLDQSGA